MGKNNKLVIGLDVGTTKICAVVTERNSHGDVRVLGIGTSPSEGLRKGVVVNIESTVESIGRAIEAAEDVSSVEVNSVFAGIAGGHIKGINSRGVIPISKPDGEITEDDIERVINAAKAVAIPMDRELIHAIPQEFIVDGQHGIKDPRGMTGVRLEAEVHIVTGAVTSAQNIIKCINRAGFEVEDIVLEPLASSIATLTEDEKESGVLLIDIGGGTTDFILFIDGAVRYSDILSIGGDHVTRDISIGLKLPHSKAEEVKKRHGYVWRSMIDDEEYITEDVPKSISRTRLCEIIELRMEEILTLLKEEVEKTGYLDLIGSGIVLTGGASLLKGTLEMTGKIFDLPARLGLPRGIAGLADEESGPIYATGVGLAQYGFRYRDEGRDTRLRGRHIFLRIMDRMREWLEEFL